MPERRKTKDFMPYIFIIYELFFTALFICEVPGIVFWAPVLLLVTYLIGKLYKKEAIDVSVSLAVLAVYTVLFIYFKYTDSSSLYYQSYIHLQAVFMFFIGYNFFNNGKDPENRRLKLEKYFCFVSAAVVCGCFL